MNNKVDAKKEILEFLNSEEKCALLTGTHQFNKHKLVMAVLNNEFNNANIHFRINGMDNITTQDFLGFAKVKKKPKSGEKIKVYNNYYSFDSFNSRTWSNTRYNYDVSIVYPIDYIVREEKLEILDNIFNNKEIKKIFLVSWTDNITYDYSKLDNYYDRHIIYDALEENEKYHNRVLDICSR